MNDLHFERIKTLVREITNLRESVSDCERIISEGFVVSSISASFQKGEFPGNTEFINMNLPASLYNEEVFHSLLKNLKIELFEKEREFEFFTNCNVVK
ncbi:MAG: hypothetical protein EZS26_000717 [Candidatus Ordinivivax streblomastigis]|uniref:Uncharacterized protein n=1 Tax=Candidatus Ordinivivax streblomastigis TaxID=2540710 RepID=A0A5M8P404_9BACT|nr:MAG: hypothetical protein EZS26_000717 [Candidatus Ordinivivax streblomastigis]